GAREAQISKIGQNAQSDPATGDLFDTPSDSLRHSVDSVGTHGVTHVHQQMNHDHGAARRGRKYMHFNILAASAQLCKDVVATVGVIDDGLAMLQYGQAGAVRVAHASDLYL